MGVEDDCVCCSPKLFVGQIPFDVGRASLLSVFESFGRVHRIDMLTPRQLNLSTRSAMIWFETWSDVERILDAANDDRFELGGTKRLVIRIADPPKRGENCVGIKPKKLFIGQIPREVKEVEVERLFSQFGVIEELEMPKRLSAVSCAFVRFQKWSQAETAIHELNEKFQFPESKRPLVVKFADAKSADSTKSTAQLIGEKRPLTPDDRSDFIKRPFATSQEGERRKVDPLDMGYLSSRMGMPMGMGTLTGMGRIEWIQEESKRFLKNFNGRCLGMTLVPSLVASSSSMQRATQPLESEGGLEMDPGTEMMRVPDIREVPVGANGKLGKGFSDPRVKEWTLFVGQIPHQANEYTLWTIFRPFGDILELNVLRKDGKHRGCAFVTYESREVSLAAIEKLDGMSFPWDSNQRKLVVRFREKNSRA